MVLHHLEMKSIIVLVQAINQEGVMLLKVNFMLGTHKQLILRKAADMIRFH